MIRELSRTLGDAVFENLGRAAGRVQENSSLPVDVLEGEEAYLVVFDAPGVEATDVQVRYVADRVEVRLERFREPHEGFEMTYPGRGLSLSGEARLPDDAAVDPEEATATLRDDGTLAVRVPKVEAPLEDDTVEEADEREDAGTPVDEVEAADEAGDPSASGEEGGPTSVVERADDGEDGDEGGA